LPQSASPSPTASPGSAERFCSSCGKPFPAGELTSFGDSAVCAWCKPSYEARLRQGMAATPRPFEYAGFWIRALAYVIDGVIIGMIRWAILLPLGIGFMMRPTTMDFSYSTLATVPLASLAVSACYFVFFWTQYGATPGKMALGLKVVTPRGGVISPGQAVGRYFAQILSGLILCIGFMMAGWDPEKRALHDRLADTRVIRAQ
ncbi:MAG: RDD family protein, partial [Bryobacteraceae bacterium]